MTKGEQSPFIAMVACKVSIHGLFAEISKTFTIFNPNQRDMETALLVPLPPASVLCGHALDINGRMRDAVVVSKKEGRKILETEIRKNIDPGLVEKVQGNIHRIRVYPLPSMGWRTVSVTWISELGMDSSDRNDSRALFHLPMGYLQDVDESSLSVILHGADQYTQYPENNSPEIRGGQGQAFTVQKNGDTWEASCRMSKGIRVDDLVIRLPALETDQAVFIEQEPGGEYFFAIRYPVSPNQSGPSWHPHRIALAWDSSGSRKNTAKELELLARLLEEWQEVVVDLVVFRDQIDTEMQQRFTVSKGDSRQLLSVLAELPCDGATNLAAFDPTRLPHPETEAWLLFSDGLMTAGKGFPETSPIPVHTITAQVSANSFLLDRIADHSGGGSYNLLQQSVEQAAAAILAGQQSFTPLPGKGCDAIQIQHSLGWTTIMGRLLEEDGLMQIRAERGEDTLHEFHLSIAQAVPGQNIARLWACNEAEHRSLLEKDNSAATALGQRYGVVTSGSSLLVLDKLEQYLEHGVEPPETEPELLARYKAHIQRIQRSRAKKRKGHLDKVHKQWRGLFAWWQTDFSKAQQELATEQRCCPASDLADAGEGEADAVEDWGALVSERPDDSTGSIRLYSALPDSARYRKLLPEKESHQASIKVQPWTPDMPYLKELEKTPATERYQRYLELREQYTSSPSFFLDCGDYFLKQQMQSKGVRILSNLLELDLENPALMRTCAYRLQQAGELDAAVDIFTDILAMREDEPQSHRDLGLALSQRWQRNHKEEDLISAMRLLWAVVKQEWQRFPEIELTALLELNRLIRLAEKKNISIPEQIEQRFRTTLDLDLRISLSWDADLTDVDLHVLEPTGEHAYYGYRNTRQGAMVSRDVRDGYGPEEYLLKKAVKGVYTIKAHYYASDQQSLCGPCTVMVSLFTDYARDNEQEQTLVLRIDKAGQEFLVGEVSVD
jgi:tetratricopeptide (TPR) repeat protein